MPAVHSDQDQAPVKYQTPRGTAAMQVCTYAAVRMCHVPANSRDTSGTHLYYCHEVGLNYLHTTGYMPS